eukprot:1668709-Amphidinium_carterae.1
MESAVSLHIDRLTADFHAPTSTATRLSLAKTWQKVHRMVNGDSPLFPITYVGLTRVAAVFKAA